MNRRHARIAALLSEARAWKALPILLALGLAGCGLGHLVCKDGAVDEFAATYSCPSQRLTTQALALKPQELFERRTPSAEIAADPARLKYWEGQTDQGLAEFHDLTLVNVTGCGARLTYLCWIANSANPDAANVVCHVVSLDSLPTRPFGGFAVRATVWQSLSQRLAAAR